MTRLILSILIFSMTTTVLLSQQVQNRSCDTVFMDRYQGAINYQFKQTDSIKLKQGKVSFSSDLYKGKESNSLRKIRFDGNYFNNLKHGQWTFSEYIFDLVINDLNEKRTFQLDYELNGRIEQVTLNYSQGVPNGKWLINKTTVENGVQKKSDNFGELFFLYGLATGDIKYKKDETGVEFSAKLNDLGFFDGPVEISYKTSVADIIEKRIYQDGFLIKVDVYHKGNLTPQKEVVYDDVIERLNRLKNNEETNFRIADEGFGLLFNNGYTKNSGEYEKIIIQEKGNEIISEFFHKFDKFTELFPEEQRTPIYNLTRRFEFVYPEEEKLQTKEMLDVLTPLCESYEEFINSPRNKLHKQKSNELIKSLVFIKNAGEKCNILEQEIVKIDTGYYKHNYRPNYYKNGVSGLNSVDTLKFIDKNGDSSELIFDVGHLITNEQNIVSDLSQYLSAMKKKTAEYKRTATEKLKVFEQQDVIDSLDYLIFKYQEDNDSLFGKIQDLLKEKFDDLSFEQKIRVAYYNEKIGPLKDNYLEAEEFDAKRELGEKLHCYSQVLVDNYDRIKQIGVERSKIDSTFTIYEENPFDERKFESRILGSIREKGGNFLARYYIDNLLKVDSCEEIDVELEKLEKLYIRLNYLAKNHESVEVIRINRIIRRESTPARIEKVLDL